MLSMLLAAALALAATLGAHAGHATATAHHQPIVSTFDGGDGGGDAAAAVATSRGGGPPGR